MAGQFFELQADGTNIPLTIEGELNGDGTIEPLTLGVVPEPSGGLTPLAPTVTSGTTMDSRTQYTLTWVAPLNTGRPPITGYEVFRSEDGAAYAKVGSTLSASTFQLVDSGLATDTPEIVWRYYVRAINADGNGDASNVVAVQWNTVVTPQPPLAPFGVTVGQVLETQATMNWGQGTDATVTKNGIWRNGVLFRDNLPPTATSHVLSGLTPGTLYTNMTVRRYNAEGWSPFSNPVQFTTAQQQGIAQDPVMGQSVPDTVQAGPLSGQDVKAYRTQIDAIRVYNLGDLIPKFNTWQPRVIGWTDDPYASPESPSIVDRCETALINFYEGSGSADRQDCELHIALGNEVDRSYTTGNLPAAFINNYAALRDVVHQTTGGTRRFPNASVWVDMTANNLRQFGAGPRFKAIAQYLDGMACSMYPAGRTIQTSNPLIEYDPASYPPTSLWSGLPRNAYSFYCDPVFDALADWRASGGPGWSYANPNGGASLVGQLDQFATWEVGIPIHHSLTTGSFVRTGADATDLTQKPRYLVGGAKTSGAANTQYDMKGFLNYIYDKCVALDVSMREQLYWNQQSNVDIPNLWETDAGKTSPDSVTAWYQWSPGYRLPNI